jgi:hypothetical protein
LCHVEKIIYICIILNLLGRVTIEVHERNLEKVYLFSESGRILFERFSLIDLSSFYYVMLVFIYRMQRRRKMIKILKCIFL